MDKTPQYHELVGRRAHDDISDYAGARMEEFLVKWRISGKLAEEISNLVADVSCESVKLTTQTFQDLMEFWIEEVGE